MSTDSQEVIEPPVEHENNRKRKAKNINLMSKAATNGKRIKWDCDRHFSDEIEGVPPSNPQSPVAASQDHEASASNPDRVPREKCKYGARCYR